MPNPAVAEMLNPAVAETSPRHQATTTMMEQMGMMRQWFR